jgi:hypothetical protein
LKLHLYSGSEGNTLSSEFVILEPTETDTRLRYRHMKLEAKILHKFDRDKYATFLIKVHTVEKNKLGE